MPKQVQSVTAMINSMGFSEEMQKDHILKMKISDFPSKAARQLTSLLTKQREKQKNFLVIPKASRSAKSQSQDNKAWDLQLERLETLIAKLNAIGKRQKKTRFSIAANESFVSIAA